jgi:MSHA biogenesis protein MshP
MSLGNKFPLPTRRLRRGFALVSAIFLLVVLAGLGVAMVTFSTSQHVSSGMDVMGARAYQAARAGVEWGLFQRLNPQARGAASSYCTSDTTAVTNSFTLPAGTTLSSFTVTVICTPTYDAAPAGNPPTAPGITVRTIMATACNQPSGGVCPNASPSTPGYVQRTVQVTVQSNGTS